MSIPFVSYSSIVLCYLVSYSSTGGPLDQGDSVGSSGASARLLSLLGHEQHGLDEHVENEYAQDVRGSLRGSTGRNKALLQIDTTVIMEMFTIF